MKTKISILLALSAFGYMCWLGVRLGVNSYYSHKEPPPGWTIVTNGKGKYAPQYPGGLSVIDRDYRSITYGMSYQRAINRAWEQYEYEKAADERAKSWKKE